MLKEIQSHFDASLANAAKDDPLLLWRKKLWGRLQEVGWPTPRSEPFQHVPLKELSWFPPAKEPKGTFDFLRSPPTALFFDGFLTSLTPLPEGVVGLPLDFAMRSYGVFLQNRMTKTLKEELDPFALLNGAFQGRGLFLYVPPGKQVVLNIQHQTKEPGRLASPRLVIYVGEGAKLTLAQRGCGSKLFNAHLDLVLEAASQIVYRDSLSFGHDAFAFRSIRASLKRKSSLTAYLFFEGARIDRTSLKIQLAEEGSEALVQGLWKLQEARQTHVHALLEHLAPATSSRQHFKGVLRERSRSSFEGKIYVHPEAQKTESYQLSHNLLLSDEAVAYVKPNLEIFADDVKASHGATLSRPPQEDLFYLRSRGLFLSQAEECWVEGFCRELAECLPEATP